MNVRRCRFRLGLSVAIALLIAVATTGVSAAAASSPSATSTGSSGCEPYDRKHPSVSDTYTITFYYDSPAFDQQCIYKDQESWMQTAKNSIAHGVQGQSGPVKYFRIDIDNLRTNGLVTDAVSFHGAGAKAYIEVDRGPLNGAKPFDGPSGWASSYKGPCNSEYKYAFGTEGEMIQDNAYHIAQIVRSHNADYSGYIFSAAKLTSASGINVVYNGANCSAG